MCIPSPSVPAPAPVNVPSMQAADNLQLGGSTRGAAQIGRLDLRLGGPGSASQGSSTASSAAMSSLSNPGAAPSAAQPVTPAAAPAASSTTSTSAGTAAVNYGYVPNSGLRLGTGRAQ